MPRTKLGRAAKAVTKQDLEADLHDVCELAKKSADDAVKWQECHDWINDILDARDFAMKMNPRG
jgi:hypothetical protein